MKYTTEQLTGKEKDDYIKNHFPNHTKEEPKTEPATNFSNLKISFHSLSDYVGGECITKSFDLDLIDSLDELHKEIKSWLNEITKEKGDGELREEWIVCDYENIPSRYVGEYDIDAEFFEYKEVIENSSYDAEVFEAGLDCDINLEDIEEAYNGEYDSDEDFVQQLLEDTGDIPENMPNYIHIDWESIAREIMYDYNTSDGHYFRNF